MAAVMTSLDKLVDTYLQDADFQRERETINHQRLAHIQAYESITKQFIDRTYSLTDLHNGLKILRRDQKTAWGMHNTDVDLLLAELSKLVRYHARTNPDIEANFRAILRDLSPPNIGQCIDRCYSLFMADKLRLEASGLKNGFFVPPGNSAFLISLFACWLGTLTEPYVYSSSMREGISALIRTKFLLAPANIKLGQRIEIKSAEDYQTVVNLLGLLAAHQPRIKTDIYWSEHFFVWLRKQLKKNPTFLNNIIFNIEVDPLEDEDTPIPPEDDAFSPPIEYVIEPIVMNSSEERLQNKPLRATPEPLLSRLIAEVRKQILIDEKVVRDIYYALLGGHLILTGPPGTGKTELARLIPEILWCSEK
ncbi:MAG TPA: hypothetical protein VFV38_26855, partial [Ktedonobacteraceae bacterium]|nr:hypothetical protein [Ktedonobacteraceae bacterium]